MKVFFIVFSFSISVVFAQYNQVNTGDNISANKFNNSTFMIGDIKHSLLTESEFQQIAGDCWKKLDGVTDVSDTDFGSIKKATAGNPSLTVILPNSNNQFLRDRGDGGLGTIQADATAVNGLGGNTNTAGNHSHYTVTDSSGDSSAGSWSGGSYLAQRGSTGDSYYRLKGVNTAPTSLGKTSTAGNHSHTLSITSTESETRPTNLGVNLFIKVNNDCN